MNAHMMTTDLGLRPLKGTNTGNKVILTKLANLTLFTFGLKYLEDLQERQ